MARVSLTRLGLKRERDRLARLERFLPALKLRQQQIQLALRATDAALAGAVARRRDAQEAFDLYRPVLGDLAGFDLAGLAEPAQIRLGSVNVAGVPVPVLEEVAFRRADYSLFATPPWVDRALGDLRTVAARRAEVEVLERRRAILRRDLSRVIQRVNLFEKVKIPEARQAIQAIRIHLGDEDAAAVGRSKIAKARLVARSGAPDGGGPP